LRARPPGRRGGAQPRAPPRLADAEAVARVAIHDLEQAQRDGRVQPLVRSRERQRDRGDAIGERAIAIRGDERGARRSPSWATSGAPRSAAVRAITSIASGGSAPHTTGIPGLMTPAFSA